MSQGGLWRLLYCRLKKTGLFFWGMRESLKDYNAGERGDPLYIFEIQASEKMKWRRKRLKLVTNQENTEGVQV